MQQLKLLSELICFSPASGLRQRAGTDNITVTGQPLLRLPIGLQQPFNGLITIMLEPDLMRTEAAAALINK